jgi:hypothetical protein
MEGQRFDRLARAMISGAGSRRRQLRALLGGIGTGADGFALIGAPSQGDVLAGRATEAGLRRKLPRNDPRCPANKPFASNTTCPSEATACSEVFGAADCVLATDGTRQCAFADVQCPDRDECDRNADCRTGEVCVKIGCQCGNRRRNVCTPKAPMEQPA